jgi:hypothetical protein
MKRVLGILPVILVIGFAGCSNKPRGNLDGFLDIPWGENIYNAGKVLEEKGYSWKIEDGDIKAVGRFAGQNAKITLSFFKRKFYRGSVDFPSKKSKSDYDEYVSIVTEKYGKPSSKKNDPPLLMTVWDFDNDSYMDVSFYFNVSISYTEREMRNKYIENITEQNRRQEERKQKQKEQERQEVIDGL